MAGSLIGRVAMQKSGRYAVEYGADHKSNYFHGARILRYVDNINFLLRSEGKDAEKVRDDIDSQQLPALFNPSRSRANRLLHKLCCPLYGGNARIEVFSLARIFLILISRFI